MHTAYAMCCVLCCRCWCHCRGLPVPHIGWNTLDQLRASDLLASAAPSDRVYYVHSYRYVLHDGGTSRSAAEWQ